MLPVQDMLSRTAGDHPHREAIACRGRRISYAELDERATRIARFLRSGGVGHGERVAVWTPKCLDEVPVIFGILRAGCVLVHVNPAFRDEQFRHVMEETGPVALFVHPAKSATVERLTTMKPRLLLPIDGDFPSAPPFSGRITADDLAAVIYTSGTTARSKGIMVTHRIFSDATTVSAEVLANSSNDRLISLTPFSFDGSLSQLFTSVLAGASLVLQDSQFPRDVVRTLIEERITGFHAMPSFWRMMLERHPAFAAHEFPHLRYLSLVGEVFPEAELLRLKSILRTTDFYMMYGTTEAFRSTCLHPRDFDRKRGSAGKPLPGVELTIVDDEGRPCAAGQAGEIVHCGAFVSPGYWKRDGGTTFRANGVHTGDLGMLDTEGYLYFIGRRDTMVKRLGFQVYPEEVEAFLSALPGVALAAVVYTKDAGHRLHAFVVPEPAGGVTVEMVAAHCRSRLPHYMQPDGIALRPALPLTGTFKIDRARLTAMVTS